ncbi:MAG TPA: TolC family protein [Chitinophagaceae bacterium]|nr:TolC family protein [Chitinophagaceae bacterium]
MKKLLALFLFSWQACVSQTLPGLTLQTAREMALIHYPAINKLELIRKESGFEMNGLNKEFLPHLNLAARATYQSAVTELPFKIPSIRIPEMSKDQYNAALSMGWLVYDGGYYKTQKELDKTMNRVQNQEIKITLDQLKDLVDNLFMDILYERDYISITHLRIRDLASSLNQITALVGNGTMLPADADLIRAEMVETKQDLQSQQISCRGLLDMLGILMDSTLQNNIALIQPVLDSITDSISDIRPELGLYSAENNQLELESQQIRSLYLPRVSLTGEGGYGRPGLNFLDNNFSFYYLAGVKLSMPVWDWRSGRNQRNILRLRQTMVKADKATFEQGLSVQLSKQYSEISRYRSMATSDNLLVQLRSQVEKTTASRLAHGAATPHDYIEDLDAAELALQNQQLHHLQFINAQLIYQEMLGH